jgi:uncharacterized membrane protein
MMSTVHFHLLLNHLPIIVPVIGLALLALAVWKRSDLVARVGLALLATGALSTLPTYLTGEGAEDAVEKLPEVTKALIEQHADMALVAAVVTGLVGVLALWILWRYRSPSALPRALVRTTLIGAVIGCGLMAYTGLLGGQIRHTEVRPGYVPAVESTHVSARRASESAGSSCSLQSGHTRPTCS